MAVLEWTLVLLIAAVVLTAVARRLTAPYPSLLAMAGAAIAFLPIAPPLEIEPELALALFVAPVLLDAAFDTSPRDLRANWVPLTSLVFVAVALTTGAVALAGVVFVGLPLAAAIALGAIVAPPDAAAAASVLGPLRLPRRLVHVLQGESLLNDAVALLIYRVAVAAAIGVEVSLAQDGPLILLAVVGSPIAGYALARLYIWGTSRVHDAPSSTTLQFVGTLGVWLAAERVGLSAIITTVAYAMTLAQLGGSQMGPRMRISSYAVWETVVFVLNVLAFLLMGLQARSIIEHLSEEHRLEALLVGLGVLAIVIGVRLLYLLIYSAGFKLAGRWFGGHHADGEVIPKWKSGLLVGWCGMRGLVTLATAFALPPTFPERDLIVLAAFCVVLGTLVVQGFTLQPLLHWLGFSPESAVEREVSVGRVAMMEAAVQTLDGDRSAAADLVRVEYLAAREVAASEAEPQGATEHDGLRLRAIEAQRRTLDAYRAAGLIGDEAFHRLQEEVDWAELAAAPAGTFQALLTEAGPAGERSAP
jgi:CPA1 family monovalent cation:H+ antiporter